MIVRVPADPFPFTRQLSLAEVAELAAREDQARRPGGATKNLRPEFWARLGELRLRKVRKRVR